MEKREAFAIEEGLHQAIVIKLFSGAPDLKNLRTLLPKYLGIKDHFLIGSLSPWQLFLCFNYKEETTKAAMWISSPNLALDLFAKRLLLSIEATVGIPIAIDKATQIKSRPSTARIKLVTSNVDSPQQQIIANNNAIGDVDARELMVQSGENSMVLVTSSQTKYGLQVRNLIVEQYTDEQKHNTSLKPINLVTREMSQSDMHHIHDVVASSQNSGQHSCLNVAKKSLDKNLVVDNLRSPSNSTHFEHSISEKHVIGIQIGSPARVNVQLARNVPYALASSLKDISRPNTFDLLSDKAELVNKEDEHQEDNIGSKLNAQASIFVPNKFAIRNYSSSCKETSGGVLNFFSPINTAKQLVKSDTLSSKSFENLQDDDIFEESDEDMLEICFASAARDVDISPGQKNRKIKKYHGKNQSWDGKSSILHQVIEKVMANKNIEFVVTDQIGSSGNENLGANEEIRKLRQQMIEMHQAWANGFPPPPFPVDNLEYLSSLPPMSHT
ncbi:hypothetical protein BC332_16302 [Capsicum chinense]|nr:hypothetical protein BC332_16302 [Capsicum chinense]